MILKVDQCVSYKGSDYIIIEILPNDRVVIRDRKKVLRKSTQTVNSSQVYPMTHVHVKGRR